MITLEKSFGENVWSTAAAIITLTNLNKGGTFKINPNGTYEPFKPKKGYLADLKSGLQTDIKTFNSGNNTELIGFIQQAANTGNLITIILQNKMILMYLAVSSR